MSFRLVGLAAATTLALAVPVQAHHSHAMYTDGDDMINLGGAVSEVHWTNPHVWLYLDVADEQGQTSTWALEGGSITALTRGGWSRDSIEVGDDITVRCRALRNGSAGCLLGFVTSINGAETDKEFD